MARLVLYSTQRSRILATCTKAHGLNDSRTNRADRYRRRGGSGRLRELRSGTSEESRACPGGWTLDFGLVAPQEAGSASDSWQPRDAARVSQGLLLTQFIS